MTLWQYRNVTPEQLRKLMKSHSLTIRAAAQALGMNERQLYRYLSGEVEIPLVVEIALRCITTHRDHK